MAVAHNEPHHIFLNPFACLPEQPIFIESDCWQATLYLSDCSMSNTVITFGIFILQRSRWHVFASSSEHLSLCLYAFMSTVTATLVTKTWQSFFPLTLLMSIIVFYISSWYLIISIEEKIFSLFVLAADFVFCSEIVLVYFNFQFQMNVQMEINCVHLSLFITLFNNFPCPIFNLHLFIILSASFSVVLLFCQHYYIIDGVRSWYIDYEIYSAPQPVA